MSEVPNPKAEQVFTRLRALAELRRRHLPYLRTVEDHEIAREIGYHQSIGAPLTLKQLLNCGIGSAATLQRRLKRLKDMGTVLHNPSRADGRATELTLSAACMRAFLRYGEILVERRKP